MAVTFALLTPFSGRYVHPYWAISLASIRWPSNSSHVFLHAMEMKRDLARNTLVKAAIKCGAKYVLFIDDDTQPPMDVVVKLHEALVTADEDVVACSGIYTSKCIPAEPYVYIEEDGAPHWKWRAGDVFPCHSIGTGCMMIKTSAFEKIPEPWFRDIDTLEEAKTDPGLTINPSIGELRITDDIYFALKVRKAGLRMLAHGGVLCVHWDQNGNPYTVPRDSYPMRGVKEEPWYSQFGVTASNLIAPEREVVLPDGFLAQDEANELYRLADGRNVLEMGAFKGRSTVCMAMTAKSVTSVDWHRGDMHTAKSNQDTGSTLEEYRRNIKPYPNIIPVIGRFEDEIPKLAGNTYDLVFVDGQHDKESVIRDVKWALEFKPQVLAVHDWGVFDGVAEGVKELGLEATRIVGTLAIFEWDEVPDAATAA
jgi:hypothetical protein